jgi:hypothetical protein
MNRQRPHSNWRWRGRLDTDAVPLRGFGDRVRRRLPRRGSHDEGAQLTRKVHELLTDDLHTLTQSLERLAGLGRRVQPPHSLAVIPTTGGFRHNGPALLVAEGSQCCRISHHATGRTWSPQGSQAIPHDRLVLSVHERRWSRTNRHTGRLKIAKQPGWYVFVVKGHDVAFGRKAAHGGRVGVVPDRNVVHDLCCRRVRALGKQPHVDTQSDGRGVHHPRQLPTADDSYGEGPTPHPPKRTGHYDG